MRSTPRLGLGPKVTFAGGRRPAGRHKRQSTKGPRARTWRRAVRRVEPCECDGEMMYDSRTSELLFPPADVAAYISSLMTLDPVTCWLTMGASRLLPPSARWTR
jgi:hypothetical protein